MGAVAAGKLSLRYTVACISDSYYVQDVSYCHITRSKPAGFFGAVKSEKQFLTLHATNDAQFLFRFKPVAGVAAVDIARLKARLDESLAVIQDLAKKKKQQQQQHQQQQQQQHLQQSTVHHRASLPHLPPHSATPVPGASSLHGPQRALPLATVHRRIESALVFAPAPPLPRCTCVCACHCMPTFIPFIHLSPTSNTFPHLFPASSSGTCKLLHLRAPVLVADRTLTATEAPLITIQQAIALALQNQQQEASKPRATSLPTLPAVKSSLQAKEHVQSSGPFVAGGATGPSSKLAGGGMAALMTQEQQAREGELVVRMIKYED